MGAGYAQEDDQHDEQYSDCSWCYRAGPVEAWTRGEAWRDWEALAGRELPDELALLEAGALAQDVACRGGGKADGGDAGGESDPGAKDAVVSVQGGRARGGRVS